MGALCAAVEPLRLKDQINLGRMRNFSTLRAPPKFRERFCVVSPAFKAGAMTGGQGSGLIEEEKFGVAGIPNFATSIFELQNAANPLPRGPAPISECQRIAMKAPAAIAEEQSACGRRNQIAKGIDTVLQRHALLYRRASGHEIRRSTK